MSEHYGGIRGSDQSKPPHGTITAKQKAFRQGLRLAKKLINLVETDLDESIYLVRHLPVSSHLVEARQQLKLASRHLAAFLDDTE